MAGTKEYPVPNKRDANTSSSFRSGHGKGSGLPAKPTKTKRAGHRI